MEQTKITNKTAKPKTKMQNSPTGLIIFIVLLIVGIASLIGFRNLQKKLFQDNSAKTVVEETVMEDLNDFKVVSQKAIANFTKFVQNREIDEQTGLYFTKQELDLADSFVDMDDYNLADKVGNIDIFVNKSEIKNFTKSDLSFLKSILVEGDSLITNPKIIILVNSKDQYQGQLNPFILSTGAYVNYYYDSDFLESFRDKKEVLLYEMFQTDLAREVSKSYLFQLVFAQYLNSNPISTIEEGQKPSIESIYANSSIFESMAKAYGYAKFDSNDKFSKSDVSDVEYDYETVIKDITDDMGLLLSGQIDSFALGNYKWVINYLNIQEDIIIQGKPYFKYIAIDPLLSWSEKMKENDMKKVEEIRQASDFVSITTYRINDRNKDSYLLAANNIEEMLTERNFVISASTKDLAKTRAVIEANFVGRTIYIEIENYESQTEDMKGSLVFVVEGINY